MAVVACGWWSWASRLQDAADAVHRAATRLASPTDGPFSTVLRTAASDVWGGPFADQLRGALSSLDRALMPWTEHLFRLHTALDQALTEVKFAMAAEASGVPSTYDPIAALTPWRRWPAPALPLTPGWAQAAGRSSGFVWVYPDRARQVGSQLRVAGEELRAGRRRLAAALAALSIDAPVGLDLIANASDEIAAEVLRRVEALEQADRRTVGTFATVGELGFPGSLAPPADFDPALLRSLERAGATTGPGRQPTQATEADPVSVATGNYLHEMVDLALPGRGLPTVFSRTYNSFRAASDGPLGFGWSTNLGVSLRLEADAVVLCGADGREEHHAREVAGELSPPAGDSGRLRVDGDGCLLYSDDGVALGDPVGQVDPLGLFCWTGKSHGKCRGLRDVVDRGRELLREAAPALSTVATITSTVVVVAAGVSLVCPPCAVAGIPIATAAKGIGTAASVVSWAALGTTCAGAGIDFDCAVGVASRSLLVPAKRFIDIGIARSAVPEGERVLYARFGKGIAGTFLKGTASAGKMGRPGK